MSNATITPRRGVDRIVRTAGDVAGLGTILGVWAHPDDEVYLSAGVMAAAAAAGNRVVVVTATRGEHGTDDPARWPPAHSGCGCDAAPDLHAHQRIPVGVGLAEPSRPVLDRADGPLDRRPLLKPEHRAELRRSTYRRGVTAGGLHDQPIDIVARPRVHRTITTPMSQPARYRYRTHRELVAARTDRPCDGP